MTSKTFLKLMIPAMAVALVACGKSNGGSSHPTGPLPTSQAVGGGDSSGGDVPRLQPVGVQNMVNDLKADLHHAFRRFFYFAKPRLDEINPSISLWSYWRKSIRLRFNRSKRPAKKTVSLETRVTIMKAISV